MQAPSEVVRVAVWDRFVRLFHWSLVGCVLVNAFLLDDGETLHRWLGYTASALVLARIVWGFVGSRHARFDDFFPTPTRLKRHVLDLLKGQHTFQPGHNPVGALMIFVLCALVLGLGIVVSVALGLLLICILLALPVRWYLNRRAAARLAKGHRR